MLECVVERKRHAIGQFTIEVAKIIDAEMASRRPKVRQVDLAKATGIEESGISRLLKPSKPMLLEELAAICKALNLDLSEVLDRAKARVDLQYPVETEVRVNDSEARPEPATSGEVRSRAAQRRQE